MSNNVTLETLFYFPFELVRVNQNKHVDYLDKIYYCLLIFLIAKAVVSKRHTRVI